MTLLRALASVPRFYWWTFVAWCGGPDHPSYSYARLAAWESRDYLRRWLAGRV